EPVVLFQQIEAEYPGLCRCGLAADGDCGRRGAGAVWSASFRAGYPESDSWPFARLVIFHDRLHDLLGGNPRRTIGFARALSPGAAPAGHAFAVTGALGSTCSGSTFDELVA